MNRLKVLTSIPVALFISLLALGAVAQQPFSSIRAPAMNIIVPQTRTFAAGAAPRATMTRVEATVEIIDQVATTTLNMHLSNPSGSRLEAELIVPVPDKAVVRGFSYQGGRRDVPAEILSKEEARKLYESLVARLRDPALLEFVGYNLVRTSVFPVEPNATQQVRLIYEHVLEADGNRVDYVLPRSESLEYRIPWSITAKIRSRRPISTTYSPSHVVETRRLSDKGVVVRIAGDAAQEPGPFRLSYLREDNELTASLLAYPDETLDAAGGGGYFLLLAGLPPKTEKEQPEQTIKREVTLVFDRSGSMHGEKIDQVREAAFQVLAGLEEGEAFNVVVYNETVDRFAAQPVLKTEKSVEAAREYLKGVKARGGTNIHDALLQALEQEPAAGMLPIVLFLTDGLPTIGQTSERAIRALATEHNPHERRIFTFGVGVDVNTPLLDKLAAATRGTATFVLPQEDVEVKVARVFEQLAGPVLANPELRVTDGSMNPAPARTREVFPALLPDLFEGDQLVVLGQYLGVDPLHFVLRGNYRGQERVFRFRFELEKATTRNGFVPRLWASRKIGFLIDALREMGGNGPLPVASAPVDPRTRELVDEIVRLSTEFGILTEYTAFLAREGTDLSDMARTNPAAASILESRAMQVRSGLASVNQDRNLAYYKNQVVLNPSNKFFDESMDIVEVTGVQQVNDWAFYRRGNRWIDSRIASKERDPKPQDVIEFSSDAFFDLVSKLAQAGRQGIVALHGDILLEVDGRLVLIKGSGN